MIPGVPVSRCMSCGMGYFPTRLICMRCGKPEFRIDRVLQGTVEQSTVIRHAAGRSEWAPHHLASVRTSDGQLVVVGLEDPLADGASVDLFEENGKISGREAAVG
jgi:uncharacterized OB-fold protein